MAPWWRRRRREWDWFDIFGDIEEEFREIERRLFSVFDELRKATPEDFEKGPYVYGFTIRIGPDGRPQVEQFGNVQPGVREIGEREPLSDIVEGVDDITVIVELPGVEKEDINLRVDEESLEIKVDTEKRRYHKVLKLPDKVKPETAKASYKNGVLEVKLERVEKKKVRKGVKVEIE